MSKEIGRRQFLHLLVLSGVVAGCRHLVPEESTPSPITPIPPVPTVTLTVALRFSPDNDAVDYSPNPAGCDRTTIQGTVRDANGRGVSQIILRVWAQDDSWSGAVMTGEDGFYRVDLADGLTEKIYRLQLVDQSGTTLLSDVVIAPAIPSCDLNLMTVNFVAAP